MPTSPMEKTIVKNILEYLRAQGFWAVKIHGGRFQSMGLPDILAMRPSNPSRLSFGPVVLAIEVKRPGCSPTPIQAKVLSDMERAGALAFVAHSVDEVQSLVEKRP